ncbi:MAG: hypothetical protein IJ796_10255 [Lachnospiraceae bacterium]|nr:hypothetical protein [Lachnospiraceae bacterium]
MIMNSPSLIYIDNERNIVPSWKKLERIDYCQDSIRDIHARHMWSLKQIFREIVSFFSI